MVFSASKSGIQAEMRTGTTFFHYCTSSAKWVITERPSSWNTIYTANKPYEICLKLNRCKQRIHSRIVKNIFEWLSSFTQCNEMYFIIIRQHGQAVKK